MLAIKSLEDLLNELSETAEKEIQSRLHIVAMEAVEKSKEKIVKEVKDKFSYAVNVRLLNVMNEAGMQVEYTFKPKLKEPS